MSSRGPSTSGLSRNLLGDVDDSVQSSYNRRVPDEMLPIPQHSEPAVINSTQNNDMTQNDDSTRLLDYPQKIICRFNTKGFKLEELVVRIKNGFIVIRGNHDEKRDKCGLISRSFTRRIAIPRNIMEDTIRAQLFSNGILSITAEKRSGILNIPIHKINQPALAKEMNQPALRQLNLQNHTMFNPQFLTLLKFFQTFPQPCYVELNF